MRQVNDEALALIKRMEGIRLTSYQDVGGVWTIGYGHTATARPGQTITEAEAEALLRSDLAQAERTVSNLTTVDLSDGQFGALVSFVYNVGAGAFRQSTLLKKLNAGNYDAVPAELARWNKVKGKVVRGLVNRRAAEAGLWARDAHVAGNMVEAATPRGSVAPVAVGGAGAVAGAGILATAGEHASPILAAISGLDWKLAAVLAVAGVAAFVAWRFCARDGSL